MITGKGLSSFERSAANNNEMLKNGDADAVEGSMGRLHRTSGTCF